MRSPSLPVALAAAATAAALLACDASSYDAAPASGCGGTLPVPLDGLPQRGPDDAWVTVVEFGDYECPYCRAAASMVDRVVASYPGDVRFLFSDFPLASHPDARPAAIAAWCAGQQGAYWAMHDALYAPSASLDDAGLLTAAQAAGLDVVAWQACRASADAGAAVDARGALGRSLCVQGTPTYAVNGAPLLGATEDELRAAIQQARVQAIASGIPRASYYDQAVLGR